MTSRAPAPRRTPPPLGKASLALAAALAAGCAGVNPLPQLPGRGVSLEERSLFQLLHSHVGRVEVYRDFSTVFTARALFLSRDVRTAAAEWEARTRLLDPAERQALFDKVVGGEEDAYRILLGFYDADPSGRPLDETGSPWTLYLEHPDGSRSMATCLRAGEDDRRLYMRFLKWDLSWSSLYVVCFPMSPVAVHPGGFLRLVVSGPGGRGSMDLRVAGPAGGDGR